MNPVKHFGEAGEIYEQNTPTYSVDIKLFCATAPFPYPLKDQYRKRSVAWNGLTHLLPL